jgi:hypothetical protein
MTSFNFVYEWSQSWEKNVSKIVYAVDNSDIPR